MAPPRKNIARQNIGRLYDLQREVEVPEPYVLTSKITLHAPTRMQMIRMRDAETEDDADRAFFGDHYDAVMELFQTQPAAIWTAFIKDVSDHFFGPGSTDVEGKSEESSSSLTSIGTRSNGTSANS